MSPRLLIVEDDDALSQVLALHFEDQGFIVAQSRSCAEATAQLRRESADLVLLDQQLPDGTGLELLGRLRRTDPQLAVLMMTGRHDLELAIEAIKRGASDFVHKPLQIEALEHSVRRILEGQRLSREVAALKGERAPGPMDGELIGRSAAMLQVSKEIALSAASSTNVLITGESGTGKEIVARLIHAHSGRGGPFVAVNCAAIVHSLLESELFGHERGAFTGAVQRKIGKFELARGGTLFLDEVAELALPLQAKLLRAVQERSFERVGGVQHIASDARIIAATNRVLEQEVRAGRFREDLAFRLKVVFIRLPPLRERVEDIPLLVPALLKRIAPRVHRPALQVPAGVMRRLQSYPWPGNVRELENVLTQAMVHARSGVLSPDLLPQLPQGDPLAVAPTATAPLKSLEQVEAEHVQTVLAHTRGHKGRACAILGISRPALDRKIRKYGLQVPPAG
jgi:two-component system response regulator AtoC